MMNERARLLLLVPMMATLGAAAPARADPPAPAEHEAAFQTGLAQYGASNYAEAIATWESLLATLGEERGYKVLYNLGLAYQAIGDVTRAIERYGAFEREVAARPNATEDAVARAEDARSRREQLEASHGALHVHAPRRGGPVLTRVGSSEPRAAGYVVWLAPGQHTVELFVGTEDARSVNVDIERGKTLDLEATPPEPPPAPPLGFMPAAATASPAIETRGAPSPVLLWSGVGATALSTAAPITLFLVARAKQDDAGALGAGNTAYAAAKRSYDGWQTAYYASYALPASLAAATAVYALWPRRAEPARHASVAVSPFGLEVAGRF
jgi:hypothetical protein